MAIRPAADPVVEVDLAGQGVGGDVRGGIAGVDGLASSPVERSCDPGRMGSCVPRLSGTLPRGGVRFGSASIGRAGRQVQENRCDAFLNHHLLHIYCSRL